MAVRFFLALVRDMNGSEAKNILLPLFMLLLLLLYSLPPSSVVLTRAGSTRSLRRIKMRLIAFLTLWSRTVVAVHQGVNVCK